jgi:hypothetical protein
MNKSLAKTHPHLWTFLVVSVAAALVATAANGFIDFGALLHDWFCPTHGFIFQ